MFAFIDLPPTTFPIIRVKRGLTSRRVDTKAQRHQERPQSKVRLCGLSWCLCAFVSLGSLSDNSFAFAERIAYSYVTPLSHCCLRTSLSLNPPAEPPSGRSDF